MKTSIRIKMKAVAAIAVSWAVIGAGGVGVAEEAPEASAIAKAISDGKLLFDARLRYSHAEFGGNPNTANGVTYRLRAGFETGAVFDTKLLVEFDHVRALEDDFNSTLNGNTQFPVVADPNATELNRFQLSNTSLPDTKVTLGRQRIILDDARFVGNVGWRQNEQTYDALRVENASIKNLKVDVTYVDRVNRIFGDDSPQGFFEGESYLINTKYTVPIEGVTASIRGFAYLFDFENANIAPVAARLSTQTYGGGVSLASGPAFIDGSFASQTPYADNPASYNVNYYTVAAGLKKSGFLVKAGYEVLGGDGAFGFVTPLATAHKFNGFADLFLATPPGGLEDIYFQAGVTKKGVGPFALVAFNAFYHIFTAEEGGADYGDEFDAVLVVKPKAAKRLKFLVKYANYQSDGFLTDRERLTVDLGFTF